MNSRNRCFLLRSLGAGVFALGLLAGCAGSPWKTSFTPSGEVSAAAPYTGAVKIREVPWERLQTTLGELQAEWAASDTPPDEWPPDRKAARHAKLLKGLQVGADPSRVDVLGRSEFRSTDPIKPNDGKLAEVAKSFGANTVVWSTVYLGQADIVRSEPVTEWTNSTWNGPRGRSQSYTETSTVYVPIYVKADERAWVAYFLLER